MPCASRRLCRLCGVLALYVIALLLFCRGYLLSRIELPERSQCSDPIPVARSNASEVCWKASSYDRVIVLIVDALRFDAVVDEDCQRGGDRPLHVARFPKLMRLLHRSEGNASLIFKFIADPPTATMQRLKGIWTGSLPTLMDVSETFSGKQVTEDNLLAQLKHQGKRLVFVGDDTWDVLFHDVLDISMPYDSFNVEDLHTVDDAEFYPLVLNKPELWDFAAGHYLGLDHAAHMFMMESREVAEKLDQMDTEISDFLVQLMEHPQLSTDRTLLLVFGDHGMTLDGKHGSGSLEEIESVLVAIDVGRLKDGMREEEVTSQPSSCAEHLEIYEMQQIDLAVSLAFLMDVPVPYGSIGKASLELLSLGRQKDDHSDSLSFLQINAWQVDRYFNAYAKEARGAFEKRIQAFNALYAKAVEKRDELTYYSEYLDAIVSFARTHWTQFDDVSILLGIALFAVALSLQTQEIRRLWRREFGCANAFMLFVLLHGCAYFSNSFIEREAEITSAVEMLMDSCDPCAVRVDVLTASMAFLLARESLLENQEEMTHKHAIWRYLCAVFLSNSVMASIGTVAHSANAASEVRRESGWIPVAGYLALLLLGTTLYRLHNHHTVRKSMTQLKQGIFDLASAWVFAMNLFLVGWYWLCRDLAAIGIMDSNRFAQFVYVLSLCSIMVHLFIHFWPSSMQPVEGMTSLSLYMDLMPPILLLSDKIGCLVMTTTLWELLAFRRVLFANKGSATIEMKCFCLGIVGHYCALRIFFYTEHYCEFSSLRFTAAFTGFSEFEYYRSGLLLILETFSGWILLPFLLSFLCPNSDQSHHVLSTYLASRSYHLFQSMISANMMRRHLWSIRTFAPKFVFELAFLMVTDLTVLCTALLLSRRRGSRDLQTSH